MNKKNLRIKPSELNVSLIGASVSSFAVKVQPMELIKQIKEDKTFKNPEFSNIRHNISLIKKNNKVTAVVKSPVVVDLIRLYSKSDEITLEKLNLIADIKLNDMNTQRRESILKCIELQSKQIGIKVV